MERQDSILEHVGSTLKLPFSSLSQNPLISAQKSAKSQNDLLALTYVCDPVMGDTGPGLYVPAELLPVYKDQILPLADVCLPNQFEAELLTDKKITSEEEAREVMELLHDMGPATVILSSTELGNEQFLLGLASSRVGGVRTVVRVNIPKFPASFVGTGDLFTALCTAWLTKTAGDLRLTLEKTIGTMQVK